MKKQYDFDTVIDRTGTGDIMHAALKTQWGREDLLPMWVADMDFAVCPDILDAIRQRLEHPILGYTVVPDDYFPAVHDWVLSHHQWDIKREWFSYVPGIVKGIGIVSQLFVKPDEKIIVMPPVYHPFFLTPQANGRKVEWCPLKKDGQDSYDIDFEALNQICDDSCRMLILCNPHNPIGICWSRETLQRLANFCYDRHMIVISDEIHCDMAIFGNKHIPFASVSDKAAQISITFQAPTKTFNIAGVVSSHAIVPNPEIRKKFFGWMQANELNSPHIFAPIATIAAFRKGEDWRQQMLSYVEGTVQMVEDFCHERIPSIHPVRPQASFLIWLDCRELHLNHQQLLNLFVDKAHLALNDGEMFGPGGEGHMRLNVGEPRSIVRQGLEQLEQAVNDLKASKK